jgi:hypothetical protein
MFGLNSKHVAEHERVLEISKRPRLADAARHRGINKAAAAEPSSASSGCEARPQGAGVRGLADRRDGDHDGDEPMNTRDTADMEANAATSDSVIDAQDRFRPTATTRPHMKARLKELDLAIRLHYAQRIRAVGDAAAGSLEKTIEVDRVALRVMDELCGLLERAPDLDEADETLEVRAMRREIKALDEDLENTKRKATR